jgi:hypothetical protein
MASTLTIIPSRRHIIIITIIHIPKPVTEHENVTVLWNQGIQTDREILANRPDIIIKNKKDKPAY